MASFAIEVPGEANPLNLQSLYHVLESAVSSDAQQVVTGTQQLQNWEKEPRYYRYDSGECFLVCLCFTSIITLDYIP